MNSFMVDIDLPESAGEDFLKPIPYQRKYINRMMNKGVITNYSLSADRKKLWVVLHAISFKEAELIITAFPIFRYMKFKIYSLLFHNSREASVPEFWLN